jgi:aryl-alcohol dehydrogenase-like predicted oxidoreductase
MHYKLFGKSGLRVSELALGTMTFGSKNGDGLADKIVSRKLFDAFQKAGGNFMLWVHMWDSVTLIEEVMRGLDALIRSVWKDDLSSYLLSFREPANNCSLDAKTSSKE